MNLTRPQLLDGAARVGQPIDGPWKVYTFDFEDLSRIPQLPPPSSHNPTQAAAHRRNLRMYTVPDTATYTTASIDSKEEADEGPIFYRGILCIEGDSAQPVADAAGQLHLADTFLNTHGLGKGIAWVNGFNLGWYWPTMGPQMTLYVPGPVLQPGQNDILILEVEKVGGEAEDAVRVKFVDEPDFYGPEGEKRRKREKDETGAGGGGSLVKRGRQQGGWRIAAPSTHVESA